MSDAVIRSTEGRIGILTINNPPVNALAAAVRAGIKDGVEAFGRDSNVGARRIPLPPWKYLRVPVVEFSAHGYNARVPREKCAAINYVSHVDGVHSAQLGFGGELP